MVTRKVKLRLLLIVVMLSSSKLLPTKYCTISHRCHSTNLVIGSRVVSGFRHRYFKAQEVVLETRPGCTASCWHRLQTLQQALQQALKQTVRKIRVAMDRLTMRVAIATLQSVQGSFRHSVSLLHICTARSSCRKVGMVW